MPCAEVATNYKERPPGSVSKLRTYSDGARIMMLIARLVKDERPLRFCGLGGVALILRGIVLSIPLLFTYLRNGACTPFSDNHFERCPRALWRTQHFLRRRLILDMDNCKSRREMETLDLSVTSSLLVAL